MCIRDRVDGVLPQDAVEILDPAEQRVREFLLVAVVEEPDRPQAVLGVLVQRRGEMDGDLTLSLIHI